MINRSFLASSISKRCLQTHPVLEVPPEAMKDRARALLALVDAERNRLYGAHRIFLRHLCTLYPDIEEEAREIVTKAARALLGKKGKMVHQVYQPQEPSTEQSVEAEPGEPVPKDFHSCLKGIARRLVISQSNPSNGNVAMLISLANTPGLLDTCLKVLTAQRWHLRAGHEPLSVQFFTKAVMTWPVEEVEKLGDFLESAVSKESNYATLLTPKVLIAAVDGITNRIVYGSKEAENIWAWCALAIRLFNSSRTYCGDLLEMETEVCKSFLGLFAQASNAVNPEVEFKIPQTETRIQDFLLEAIEKVMTPEILPTMDKYALSCALKAFVKSKKDFPDFVTTFLQTEESYLKLFTAYQAGKVNQSVLEAIKVPKDPQGHNLNAAKFLKESAGAEVQDESSQKLPLN